MKKSILRIICVFVVLALCLNFSGCKQNASAKEDLWAEAMFTEDTELGNGEKTVFLEVVAKNKSVTFTIHSDKSVLGEALVEHHLIEGEEGAYGLYVKKVNGITADYNENQCYWGFYKNGESMMVGVDGATFENGEHYELVYTN